MKTTTAFVCAALLVTSASVKATIIVDGEFLEITGQVNEPILIVNGGRVSLDGGEVVAPAHVQDPDPGLGIRGTGTITVAGTSDLHSTFKMNGHSYLTSTDGVPLFLNNFSTARVFGDAVIAAVSSNQDAIRTLDHTVFSPIYLEDRANIIGNVTVDTSLFIAGDARITGRLAAQGGVMSLTMSGGSINNGVALLQGGRYSARISGGRIDNGFRFGGNTGIPLFTMSGGEIHGGFSSQGSFQKAHIFGGSIYGGLVIMFTQAPLSIWGGTFNADAGGWLIDTNDFSFSTDPTRRTLAIYGGQFGRLEAGQGIRLSGTSAIDIFGYDLTLTNGLLSGYLSDGNWINLSVTTNADWTGSVNLIDVR